MTFGGAAGSQGTSIDAPSRGRGTPIRPGIPLLLLTEQEAAEALGVSHRKFQELRDQPWCPKPVVLGPRLLRWSRAELELAVASMPRQTEKSEPVRERIERMKRGGAS